MVEEEGELLPVVQQAGNECLAPLAVEMERRLPHFRRDAAKAVRGGAFASVRGALGQVRHMTGRGFASS
jgi:hypothetical protein